MIKRFLLFVLLLSPVAVGDALLALTASTLPDGTTSVQEQTTKSKTGVKQAFKPSGGTTAAVGEERAPNLFSELGEGLSAHVGKLKAWVASKSAYWTNAEREGEAATELEAAWKKGDAKWERYEAAWKEEEEKASGVMVTVRSRRQWPQLENDEAELREIHAAVAEKKAAWVKEQESLDEKEIAWMKKYPDVPRSWFDKPRDLKKKEDGLVDAITHARYNIVEEEIKTYLPQFEILKADGVTREMYQDLLGLDSTVIKGFTRENILSHEPEYAKFLYFDRYLHYEGSSKNLLRWAYIVFRQNQWKV
uniref:RxLR effector candidate protein n=2 Tax=Hyaloperonospora arabidopsidis (strain Emoy2) TaxID=559515 RepID=M4BQU6_HYAAE|nr:RxLR effector candidate protein [Hyaloperonospora arabidopsidis Emoy2]BAP68958.1 RxLR effector candidate protein [Hyaloperonospora arabidopsidis Emoy2]